MPVRLFNPIAFIRLWALASRFILIALAAYALNANDFGQWTLLTTSIALLSYLIGLDLYAPSIRSLYDSETQNQAKRTIISLYLIYLSTFILIALALITITNLSTPAAKLPPLTLLLPLLFFEHISADLNRQLNMLGELQAANTTLLLRSSVPAALFAFTILLKLNSLTWLIGTQITGTALAIIPGSIHLQRYIKRNYRKDQSSSITPNNIKKNAKTLLKGCGVVFITTFTLKITQSADRFILAESASFARLGTYSLIMAATAAITSALEAIIVSTSLSELLKSGAKNHPPHLPKAYTTLRHHLIRTGGVLHFIACCAFLIAPTITTQTKYPIIPQEVVALMLASFIVNLSAADATFLFSIKEDKSLLYAAVTGLITFISATAILTPITGPDSIAYSVLLSSIATYWHRARATSKYKS